MSLKPWTKKDSYDLAAGILFIAAVLIVTFYFNRFHDVMLDGSLSLNDIAFISNHSYAENCFQDFEYSRWMDPNITETEKEALSSLYYIERNNCAKQIFTLWGIELTVEISLIILVFLSLLHQGGSYHNKVGQKISAFIRGLNKLYSKVAPLLKPKKIRLRIFKKCPFCKSTINAKATVCKHCLRNIPS